MPMPGVGTANSKKAVPQAVAVPVEKAVPVQIAASGNNAFVSDKKLTKIDIITKQSKFEELKVAMQEIGVMGMTVTQVLGCGTQKGQPEFYRGVEVEMSLLPKVEVEIVVCEVPVKAVVDAAIKVLYTGHIGDGKIFISSIDDAIKVRTGETGCNAMQGDD